MPPPDLHGLRRHIPALLFPALLWLIGSFFYLGDIGRFSDDYSLSLRTLEDATYHFPANPWTRWPYFTRPLHLILISANATLFHHTVWPPHLITALAHALAAFALYRFLLSIHLARPAAAAGAGLLLTFPFAYEVPLWPATISISIALALTLVCFTLIARWTQDGPPTSYPPPPHRLVRRCLALFLLGFCIPCFHEQSAVVLALAPLVYCIACQRLTPDPIEPRAQARGIQQRGIELTAYTAALGLACVLYAALLITTVPSYQRGSLSRMPAADELPARLAAIADAAHNAFLGGRARDYLFGSLEFSKDALLTPYGLTLFILTILAAVLWCRWAVRDRASTPSTETLKPRTLLILTFSLAWFVLAFLPLATVADGALESRLLSIPFAAISIALASLLNLVFSRSSTTTPTQTHTPHTAEHQCADQPATLRALRVLRGSIGFQRLCQTLPILTTAALAAIMLLGSISLVGFQRLMRERALQDDRLIAQLRRHIPDPPRGTVFLPLRHAQPGAATGYRRFDWAVDAGLSQPWSAWAWIARGYHRTDLSSTHLYRRAKLPFSPDTLTDDGIVYASTLPGEAFTLLPDGSTPLTWDRVIPFAVHPRGRITLHRRLHIHTPDGRTHNITCPLVPEHSAHDDVFIFELR